MVLVVIEGSARCLETDNGDQQHVVFLHLVDVCAFKWQTEAVVHIPNESDGEITFVSLK